MELPDVAAEGLPLPVHLVAHHAGDVDLPVHVQAVLRRVPRLEAHLARVAHKGAEAKVD